METGDEDGLMSDGIDDDDDDGVSRNGRRAGCVENNNMAQVPLLSISVM